MILYWEEDNAPYEDGRIAWCWGCKIEHYTIEKAPLPESKNAWLDLCETCLADYWEGRSLGFATEKEGNRPSLFHMPSVKRTGYLTGRMLYNEYRKGERRKSQGTHPWVDPYPDHSQSIKV